MTRRVVVAGFAAFLLVALVVDHATAPGRVHPAAAAAGPALPAEAPSGSLSSTWFCPPATAVDKGMADGRIVITNPTAAPLTGRVTLVPSAGTPTDVAVQVGARRRAVVRFGDTVAAPYVAALVQLDGSSGVVEEQIHGALGESVAACATRASDRWFFGWGTSQPGAQMLVGLFNPFPGDAIVDFDFATDTGRATPADLQGVIVPGRGTTVVDVGAHVRRRQAISAVITTRTGRVVAAVIQLLGTDGSKPAGAVLTMGEPAPSTVWYFPDGVVAPGVGERYELFNPGDSEADVSVALALDRGSAEPFTASVAPHDRTTLTVNGETRIPPGDAHAGVVTSTNGVPVVVDRVVTAAPPSPRLGTSVLAGAPSGALRWVFGVGAANADQDQWLVAFNPGAAPAHLSVTALLSGRPVDVDGLQSVLVPPNGRLAMRLGDHLDRGDLVTVVEADAQVVVERDLYRVRGVGMSASLGVP